MKQRHLPRKIRLIAIQIARRDFASQKNRDFDGVGVRAKFASLLLCTNLKNSSSKIATDLARTVHHGGSVHNLRKTKSILYSNPLNKDDRLLLAHQVCDRILIMQGQPQVYKTQFKIDPSGKKVYFPTFSKNSIIKS